jgi:FOG: TPR repeat, SEL1 subfamily
MNRRTWQTFDEMRKAADEGDPQAQCYLGVCFQTGQGVKQDYPEAVKWYRKAADQNDPVAQCYLGVAYQNGLGVPQEYGQAAKWFREAASRAIRPHNSTSACSTKPARAFRKIMPKR